MTTGRINQISIGAVTSQKCTEYSSTLIGVGFDRVLRFDFEKISRVHRVMICIYDFEYEKDIHTHSA